MFRKLMTTAVLCLVASSAFAKASVVTFTNAHARPSINGMSSGYFTVSSTANDEITAVSSDCCKAVELHRSEKINGMMSMRRIGELDLKKGETLEVQPGAEGGQHLMLIGVKQELNEGDNVPVTFTFKKAPQQTVNFSVFTEQKKGDASEHEHH